MPIFKRPDGDLVTDESNVRKMIPYLMLGRNESAIYHDEYYDLTRTNPWLKTYNQHHDQAATLFHLHLYAVAQMLFKRPGLNRFISGNHIYQRKGVELSFAAKKRLLDTAPMVTVKVPFEQTESFTDALKKIVSAIHDGRSDRQSTVDAELKLAMALPGPLLSFVMGLLRRLDRWNLLPQVMIKTDPMYASCFVANLGSVGIDNTYHHLYEYGTISLFSVLGAPKKTLVVGPGDQPIVKQMVQVRWTFDERINDGLYCAMSMKGAQRIVEDPERYLGDPKAGATKFPALAGAAPTAAGTKELAENSVERPAGSA